MHKKLKKFKKNKKIFFIHFFALRFLAIFNFEKFVFYKFSENLKKLFKNYFAIFNIFFCQFFISFFAKCRCAEKHKKIFQKIKNGK